MIKCHNYMFVCVDKHLIICVCDYVCSLKFSMQKSKVLILRGIHFVKYSF